MAKKEATVVANEDPKQNPNMKKRQYKDSITFDHDLFRLQTATMQKNMSWNKKPLWEPMDHKHFFHTFDSDGRKQSQSTPALGHFHPITVVVNGPDVLPTITVGKAMHYVAKMDEDSGEMRRVIEPLPPKAQHTHEPEWMSSENLKSRKLNPESLKLQSNVIAYQTPALSAEEKATIKDTGRGNEEA